MTLVTEAPASTAETHVRAGTSRPLLPRSAAFALQASIVVFFLAASSAPTPLYAVYQVEWGFTPITTTVVFGLYALSVLAALLTVGSLSDHIGRRPVLLTAIVVEAATMLVFTTATGVQQLMLARVVQGLATGAAIGAVGAAMLDLDRVKGTIASAVGAMVGTASGSIMAGLLVQYLPAPTHLVFIALFVVFVGQGIGVTVMAESSQPMRGALAALRPRITLPSHVRSAFLVAVPALVASWSLAGLYGSLGPSIVRLISGSDSFVLGGLALFTLAGSGAVAVFVLRSASPRPVMFTGTVALMAGMAVSVVALSITSTVLFFVGSAIAGVGFGGAFQGAMRSVLPLAASHERGGVLSLVFVVSYVAFGLPAVIAGYLVVHGGGVLTTAREYAAAVVLLSAVAMVGLLRPASARTVSRRPAIRPATSAGCQSQRPVGEW